MFFDAKNAVLTLDGETFDIVTFGEGDRPVVMIPGISDGFRTVEGIAVPDIAGSPRNSFRASLRRHI